MVPASRGACPRYRRFTVGADGIAPGSGSPFDKLRAFGLP
jgi:hypothetical protein